MKYNNIIPGKFISRPNRFIAKVEVNGVEETVHVKNTGRCKELLISGVQVYLEISDNPKRKTKFSLIVVQKGKKLINMDSQAPNKILEEALVSGKLVNGFPFPIDKVQSEYTYGDSRLDFLLNHGGKTTLVEVKGVTLEKDGKVFFPDAPTERGIKHLKELIKAKKEGLGAIVCFIIQMENVECFSPNNETHPEFGETLLEAKKSGVEILAFSCIVTHDNICLDKPIEIKL